MPAMLKRRARRYRTLLALLLLCLLGALLPPGPSAAQTPPEPAFGSYQDVLARAAAPPVARWDTRTHMLRLLAAPADQRLPLLPSSASDPIGRARAALMQYHNLLGLRDVDQELVFLRSEPDTRLSWTHARFDQVYHGVPVFGRQLMVHLDAQSQLVAINGQFAPGLDLPIEAAVPADTAARLALDDLKNSQLGFAERMRVSARVLDDHTKLMIYIDPSGRARLTWSLTIMTEAPLGQWRYFVNARRPAVVHAFNSLNNAKRRITYTADNSTDLPGQQMIDEGERSRDPVAQAAQDAAGTVYDYYMKNFKRDSVDGKGLTLVSTVHFGSSDEDAENAAWVSEMQQMIYGDGGRIFKPLAYGLDVVGHELTHGVTDNTAQLVYEGQSGALNESYSDVFGALIDDKNWTLGETIVKSPPFPVSALRDMEDPTLGGRYDPDDPLSGVGQPATADDYANLPLKRTSDNGGVHINSGIPNHAAYLVAQAIGREKTGQIYYRTLTQYLTPESDFADAAAATVRAAQDLYGNSEVNAVKSAFSQVGLQTGGQDTLPAPEQGQDDLPDIPAQPQQPPAIPQGCSDQIVNGGFESSDGWTEVVAGDVQIIDSELPHSGKRSAWLGGSDQERLQQIYQDVRVPPNATSAQLSYFRLIHEELSGLSGIFSADAHFSVVVAKTNGDILDTLEEFSSAQSDDEWHQAKVDVSRYAGKIVRLGFIAENTRGNISSFFVDDVALAVCTAGKAPQSPEPSDASTVFVEGTATDSSTGRGVNGVQVFILRPGLSVDQAAQDDTISDDEVLTYGTSDKRGYYRTQDAIPRGKSYSVIVVADGYRPILADDGIEIPGSARGSVQADIELRQ